MEFSKHQGWWRALQHVRSAIEDIQYGRVEQIDTMIRQVTGEEAEVGDARSE